MSPQPCSGDGPFRCSTAGLWCGWAGNKGSVAQRKMPEEMKRTINKSRRFIVPLLFFLFKFSTPWVVILFWVFFVFFWSVQPLNFLTLLGLTSAVFGVFFYMLCVDVAEVSASMANSEYTKTIVKGPVLFPFPDHFHPRLQSSRPAQIIIQNNSRDLLENSKCNPLFTASR